MQPSDVIVGPGQVIGFAIRGTFTKLLTVTNRGGLLHLQEYGGAISLISGKYLETKLIQACPKTPPGHLHVRILDGNHWVRLCTPRSAGVTGVHVDVLNDGFHIVGGASIVGTLAGNDLQGHLEPRTA